MWVWDVLWLTLLGTYIFAGLWLVPFHGDEATQIFMSREYTYHIIEGNLDRIIYRADEPAPHKSEEELRLLNGTVNKYTMGFVRELAGITAKQVNNEWDWGHDLVTNVQAGHHPGTELLHISRYPSTLFTIASLVVLLLIGIKLEGRATAYIVTLLYAVNPTILVNGRRAMMEGSLLFASLLVVLLAIAYLQSRQSRRWLYALLFGISIGFAMSSKHPAIFTIVPVVLVIVIFSIIRNPRMLITTLLQMIVVGLISLLVFYAMNPAYWEQPVAAAQETLLLRSHLLDIQVDVYGNYPDFGAKTRGFLGTCCWRQTDVL